MMFPGIQKMPRLWSTRAVTTLDASMAHTDKESRTYQIPELFLPFLLGYRLWIQPCFPQIETG